MSTFLYALGRRAYRAPLRFIAGWLAVLALVATGVALFADDFDDDFTLPGSEAQVALDSMRATFPSASGVSATVIVVAPDGESVEDPDYRDAIADAVDRLGDLPHVAAVTSPFDETVKGTISADESAALISVQYDGTQQDVGEDAPDRLLDALGQTRSALPGAQVDAGGELFQITGVHVSWVEGIGVLIAFLVLLLTLGSFRAAGMPLLTALIGVAISVLLVVGATAFGSINSTSIMLALMLGLAVGIDYALFIVSRARSLQAEGHAPLEAAARATATAGSAVIFAGLTVMIALLGLSLAGIPFLTVMGIAASGAVAVAVLIALTMIPALLGLAKDRIRPRPRGRRGRHDLAEVTAGAAGTTAAEATAGAAGTTAAEATAGAGVPPRRTVMDRFFTGWLRVVTTAPVLTIVVIAGSLSLFAVPAGQLQLSLPDAGSQEKGTPARTTFDLIDEHFGPGFNGPLIMTSEIVTSDDPLGDVERIEKLIAADPGVSEVVLATPNEDATTALFQIIPTTSSADPATLATVERLRAIGDRVEDEYGFHTSVTGATAIQIDVSDRLGEALIPFGIFVVGLSIILLTIVFRSIAVPLKATGGFLLSVIASFGAVVLVFHDGYLAGPLGLDQTGPVISFLPIILMGILFGLAMDYEVFLVSGMREAWVHGASAREAIRVGYLGSARVVTAAAVIMFSVFAAFVPTGEPIIKSIALALAVGIFVDAFLVRMSLVPAIMALLGEKAWWLPNWLEKRLPRLDVEGEGLAHEVALRDWPQPDSPYRIYGRDIGAGPDRQGFAHVDLALLPGQLLTVTGQARAALLLAVSGRLPLSAGEMKIGQWVLPEHAGRVRRAVPYLRRDVLGHGKWAREITRLRTSAPELVVIDLVDGSDFSAPLQELIAEVRGSGGAVVLGMRTEDLAEVAPPSTDVLHLDLDATTIVQLEGAQA
ncbi:MMPL family transporter [Brevibacterium sp.]|uniref:MMPL family transporter n=1 Tax=Brevibacterium sp. TaxID=1701 RepID=UPI00281251B3|nr:MMPL family transporter [Brevibacterium sp.]